MLKFKLSVWLDKFIPQMFTFQARQEFVIFTSGETRILLYFNITELVFFFNLKGFKRMVMGSSSDISGSIRLSKAISYFPVKINLDLHHREILKNLFWNKIWIIQVWKHWKYSFEFSLLNCDISTTSPYFKINNVNKTYII